MSLYYDATTVLTAGGQDGSLKSRIYGSKLALKSKPAHLYAVISETAKYDQFLKEVIDKADFLAEESKVRTAIPSSPVSLLTDSAIAATRIVDSHPLSPPGS